MRYEPHVSGDGNGWVECALGHRHWGRFGAAGLLITDGTRVVLQHRAPWTHDGGTWALPGGARDSDEDVLTAALREAAEEAALDPSSVAPTDEWVDDHGGWSYTTVLARAITEVQVHAANAESLDVRWWGIDEVRALPLHRGFAKAWPSLRELLVRDGGTARRPPAEP
jgi:8-oxo-dGTP diphosphatase